MCNAKYDILESKLRCYLVNRIKEVSDPTIKSELAQVLGLLPQESVEYPTNSPRFILGFDHGYHGRDWVSEEEEYMNGFRKGMQKYREDEYEMNKSRESD